MQEEKGNVDKNFRRDGSSSPPQVEPDVVALVKKIQQHLMFLEKKIDTLISRSSEKPSQGQHFSKPFRSYGRPQHHSQRKNYNSSREGGFDRGRPFDRGEGRGNRRFDQGKKPFFHRQKKRA